MLSFAMAQVAAPGRGQFTGHIFSLKHRLIQKVLVAYNVPNPGQRASQLLQNNPAVEDGFAAMLNAYQIDSRTFIAQQTYRGRIDDLPTKGHDPVRISADGSHSSAYGRFMNDVNQCFSNASCASKISSILSHKTQAERRLNSVGLSILGFGGNIGWENAPPMTQVWLCNGNNDCALLEYDGTRWNYIESRSEGGRGSRYPKYDEELNYNLPDPVEAGSMERGLINAGFSVSGRWSVRGILGCSTAGGVKSCQWIMVVD